MGAPHLNINTACRWSLVVMVCLLLATGFYHSQYVQGVTRIENGERISRPDAPPGAEKFKVKNLPYISSDGSDSSPHEISLSKDLLKTKTVLDARMAQVLKSCQNSNYSQLKDGPNKVRRIGFGRLSYCPIAKCGTTFIRRDLTPTMRILNEDVQFSPSQRKTFFLVREPYGRLVSSFFSKIVALPAWWTLAGNIVKQFRPNASDMSVRCGHDATFSEYIKFIIKIHSSGSYKDPHFLRIMELCNICKDIPDFVAKLETIKDDMKYILNSVGVDAMTNKSFIEVARLAKNFMNFYEKRNVTNCGSMCTILNRYWYGQQATGLIDFGIELPVEGEDCQNITGEKLAELAWHAHLKSMGRVNKREVKEMVKTELYQQVSLEDREELARFLAVECEIFGYDPRPDFMFPKS